MTTSTDLLIVGGGINGAGIARDAAGRGLSVVLCEQGDLAGYTSSASTKLIHGGLRYLEYYEFRLVREALLERERLLAAAPHIIWPLRFILPHETRHPPGLVRPPRALPLRPPRAAQEAARHARRSTSRSHPAGARAEAGLRHRLRLFRLLGRRQPPRRARTPSMPPSAAPTSACARSSSPRAATASGWLRHASGRRYRRTSEIVRARVLVNAAGPFVADVLERAGSASTRDKSVRLVKGSHIVVPRLYEGDHAFILQNTDKRIVFAIPYQETSRWSAPPTSPVEAMPGRGRRSADDEVALPLRRRQPLLQAAGRAGGRGLDLFGRAPALRRRLQRAPRPSRATTCSTSTRRDGEAPVLSIFGGKITTFRKLAEHALDELKPFFPGMKPPGRRPRQLPGGDMPDARFRALSRQP